LGKHGERKGVGHPDWGKGGEQIKDFFKAPGTVTLCLLYRERVGVGGVCGGLGGVWFVGFFCWGGGFFWVGCFLGGVWGLFVFFFFGGFWFFWWFLFFFFFGGGWWGGCFGFVFFFWGGGGGRKEDILAKNPSYNLSVQ